MRSNSFDTQEGRQVGRKEARESRDFPILCTGIIDVFQMEAKKCKDQERLNFVSARGNGRREICGSRKKFSKVEEGSKRTNENPQGTWLGGAQKGSL